MASTSKQKNRTFFVGPKGTTIYACSWFLSNLSPVLKTIINDDDPVVIKEDCPKAFRALVEYSRSGKLLVKEFEVAMRLTRMSRKYTIPDLINECLKYMANDYEHWYALEYYELLKEVGDDDEKIQEAMTACRRAADELLESNRHLNSRVDTLVAMFKGEELNIVSEKTLVDALARYKEANIDPSVTDGIRTALSHVRLLAMDPFHLMTCTEIRKLLSQNEVDTIIDTILYPSNTDSMPENFTLSTVCRGNSWNKLKYTRTNTIESLPISLNRLTTCITTLTEPNGGWVMGFILGVVGNQSIPLLDIILMVLDQNGGLLHEERYRLKNLTSIGRTCLFTMCKQYSPKTKYELRMLVMNKVSLTGRHCGEIQDFGQEPTLASFERNDTNPIHALLQGVCWKNCSES